MEHKLNDGDQFFIVTEDNSGVFNELVIDNLVEEPESMQVVEHAINSQNVTYQEDCLIEEIGPPPEPVINNHPQYHPVQRNQSTLKKENPYAYKSLPSHYRLECSVCHALFQSYQSLCGHIIRHSQNRDFSCFGCNFVTNQLPRVIKHKKTCFGDPLFLCFICEKYFKNMKALFLHIQMQIVYKCNDCLFYGASAEKLNQHSIRYHKTVPKEVKCLFKCDESLKFKKTKILPQFECDECRLVFNDSNFYKEHLKDHSENKMECLKCGYVCNSKRNLLLHFKEEHGGEYKLCPLCKYKTRIAENLEAHMDYYHRPTIDNYPKFACPCCDYQDFSKNDISFHIKTNHPGMKLFSCDICEALLSSKQSLERHRAVHLDERPFTCHLCDSAFKTKGNLDTHVLTHMPSKKNKKCPLCPYTAHTKFTIKRHYRRVHTDEKPYKCKYCSFACNIPNSLTRHLRRHEKKEKCVSCTKCSYKCYETYTMRRHMKCHDGSLAYSCQHCEFRCNYEGTLTKHLSTHNLNKKYECKQCNYFTFKEQTYKKHLEFHNQESKTITTISISETASQLPGYYDTAGEDPYQQPPESTQLIYAEDMVPKLPEVTHIIDDTYMKNTTLEQVIPENQLPIIISKGLSHEGIPTDYILPDTDQTALLPENGSVIIADDQHYFKIEEESKSIVYKQGYVVEEPVYQVKSDLVYMNEHFQCSFCFEVYINESELQQHITQYHPQEFPFECKNCHYRFSIKKDLYKHNQTHHKDPIYCIQCNFVAYASSIMAIHMRKHTGERPYQCTECTKSFKTNGALKKHSLTHETGVIYKCSEEMCTFQTNDIGAFKSHTHRENRNKTNYQCSHCSFSCHAKSTFDRHFSKHVQEKKFSCSYCDFKCKIQSSIIRHMYRHNNKPKTVSCHLCDYKCYVRSTLRRHMKTHSGNNSMKCHKCDFMCNFKGTLTKHLKSHQ